MMFRGGGGGSAMAMFVLFLLANIADAGLTYYGIQRGVFGEASPLPAWLMTVFGPGLGLTILKGGVSTGAGSLLYHFRNQDKKAMHGLMALTVLIWLVVFYEASWLLAS